MRIWCVSRFHVNKNIKQTYKGGLHFTVICCTNKCIINERYIPEHQNQLNIYDLQIALANYEFLPNIFQPKKIVKFEFSIYAGNLSIDRVKCTMANLWND